MAALLPRFRRVQESDDYLCSGRLVPNWRAKYCWSTSANCHAWTLNRASAWPVGVEDDAPLGVVRHSYSSSAAYAVAFRKQPSCLRSGHLSRLGGALPSRGLAIVVRYALELERRFYVRDRKSVV